MKNTVIATPPGHTIKERLDTIGMTLSEFAERMGMKDTEVTDLLHGRTKITPDLAAKLESAIDIPSRFWLKLEAIYQNKLKILRGEQCNAQ